MNNKESKTKSHKHSSGVKKYIRMTFIYVLISLIFVVPTSFVLLKGAQSVVHNLQNTFVLGTYDLKVDKDSFSKLNDVTEGNVEFTTLKPSQKYAEISCNSVNLKSDVFYDTNRVSLRNGAGTVIDNDSLPGQSENTLIYATRKYFKNLDKIKVGDEISINTTWGCYTYKVDFVGVSKYSNLEFPYTQCAVLSTSSTNKPFSFENSEKYYVIAELVSGPSAKEVSNG